MTTIFSGIWEWIVAWWGDGNSHERFASVAIILGILLGVGTKMIQKWRHHRYRANLFTLWVPDEWPVPPRPEKFPTAIEIKVGGNEIRVGVIPGNTTTLAHFDMRFVDSKRRMNVNPDVIRISRITDHLRQKAFVIPGEVGDIAILDLWATKDESTGGMDCYYTPPLSADKSRTIWFTVRFEATQPWQGYLSFRGRDKDDQFVRPSHIHITITPPSIPDGADAGQ